MTPEDSRTVRLFRIKGTQACFVVVVGATEDRHRINIVGGEFTHSSTELKPWLSKQAFRV